MGKTYKDAPEYAFRRTRGEPAHPMGEGAADGSAFIAHKGTDGDKYSWDQTTKAGRWRSNYPERRGLRVQEQNLEGEGDATGKPIGPNEWTPDDSGSGPEGPGGIRWRKRT